MTPFLLLILMIGGNVRTMSLAQSTGGEIDEFVPLLVHGDSLNRKTWDIRFLNLLLPIGPYPTYSTLKLSDWNTYFYENEELDANEKEELLSKIPETGYDFSITANLELLRIARNPYSFWIGGLGAGRGHIPKDLIELVISGNDFGREYDVSGVDIQSIYGFEFGANRVFSFLLRGKPSLAFISLKTLIGLGYLSLKSTEGKLSTDYSGLETLLEAERAESKGGVGIAFDAGIRSRLNSSLSFSFILQDLGPPMLWFRDSKEEAIHLKVSNFSLIDLMNEDSDSLVSDSEELKKGTFKTSFPSSITGGVTWSVTPQFTLLFTSGYSLFDTPFGKKGAWAGVGMESKFYDSILGRVGLRLGGEGKFRVGAGVSLPFWKLRLDVGFQNVGGLLWSSRGGRLGFGFSTRER